MTNYVHICEKYSTLHINVTIAVLSTTSRSDLRIGKALLDVGGRHCGGSRKVAERRGCKSRSLRRQCSKSRRRQCSRSREVVAAGRRSLPLVQRIVRNVPRGALWTFSPGLWSPDVAKLLLTFSSRTSTWKKRL